MWRLGRAGEVLLELLFPLVRGRIELVASGRPWVLRVDTGGSSKYSDFGDDSHARVTPRGCPGGRGVRLSGLLSNLVGQVGDELGSFGEVCSPSGIVLEVRWNLGQPGHWTWIDCRDCGESPVEDGGNVAGGGEVSSARSILQVAVRVLACFGREVEQMGAEGWPGGFVGEAGDVVINAIEVGDRLGSDELFGGAVEAVGVALDRVEESGGWGGR